MLTWLRHILRRTPPARTARLARARYDVAQTTAENRRHWANADGLSADAANSPEVRRLLRERARYELANNSYAAGIVDTLANDTIGTGPRLQFLTGVRDVNAFLERAFADWAQAVRLAEKLRTARKAQLRDGEVFLLLQTNPRLPGPVKLDVVLVETEQVTTPDPALLGPRDVDGIRFDPYGNPVEYHILRKHPGDPRDLRSDPRDVERVPARFIVHYFKADRPAQSRGVPEILPALPLFAQLRRYTLAVLAAAETAADFAVLLHTDAPAGDDAESAAELPTIEIEPRMAVPLPEGWKPEQMRAEQPATTYAEFKRELLNEIARCLNMPFNIAAGNSASYNYASGRLDHQTYFKALRIARDHLEAVALDRLLAAWLEEAVRIDDYLPDAVRFGGVEGPHQWFWDGTEHVDPVKEATAQATRLASHTTTLAEEYARQGKDWEAELQQRARELERMRALGLTPATPAAPVPVPDAREED